MKVSDFVENFNFEKVTITNPNREIVTGYCGDLLSVVMSQAPTDSVWFTVMNNINIVAVASLADISLIVVCNADIEKEVIEKAKQQNINIVKTNLDIYNAVKLVGEI